LTGEQTHEKEMEEKFQKQISEIKHENEAKYQKLSKELSQEKNHDKELQSKS